MDAKKQRALVATAVACLIASAGSTVLTGQVLADEGHKAHCYGVNKCKGTGDCGGKGHGCAGKNECSGKGWISLDEETCLKIKDGSLKPAG